MTTNEIMPDLFGAVVPAIKPRKRRSDYGKPRLGGGRKRLDLVGQRFGRWLVLEQVKIGQPGPTMFRCRCDCGNEGVVGARFLNNGKSRSCGCLQRDRAAEPKGPRPHEDLTGRRFGRLVVLGRSPKPWVGKLMWLCRCDCGNEKEVQNKLLLRKKAPTRSCGCLQPDAACARATTHGMSHKNGKAYVPEYEAWQGAKKRCTNPRSRDYPDYGGRGIAMCERWFASFEAFYKDMGERPGPGWSLDRINRDGDYEPGNCRWATVKDQARNRRTSRFVTACGVTKTIAQWAEETGIPWGRLYGRIVTYGWEPERALELVTTPIAKSPMPKLRRRRRSDYGKRKPHLGTHNMSGTPEYKIWKGMNRRCYEPARREYPRYGGRGIKVCEAWRKSFEAFYWDMGPRPSASHSLDRLDVDGDYTPENCQWATHNEQARNKRNNRLVTAFGETKTITEWCHERGLTLQQFHKRVNVRGWPVERALIEPIRVVKK